jgi:thiopurine S-methyltransferase
MDPEFWHARWANNQIGFHQDDINPYLRHFWPVLGLRPKARVFVPLCGKSRDLLWLREQGFDVVGVELSHLAVQAFFEENDLSATVTSSGGLVSHRAEGITLYCGDFFALTPAMLGNVAGVFDRAALIALPPKMRLAYVNHMAQLLPAGATTLLITFEYPQHEMAGPPFSVPEEEVRALYGGWCAVELLGGFDILSQEPRFREKGVTALHEKVYRLACRQPAL